MNNSNINIYQEAIQAVGNGASFKIDFQSRSLKLNGKYVIQEGKYEGELGVSFCNEEEFLAAVEEFYHRYKYSVPSERSESKSRQYFLALPERCLSDDDMLYGERRDKTQIELELFILCQILGGLKWIPEKMGRWFWQSSADKDLVILRNWIEPNNNQSFNN